MKKCMKDFDVRAQLGVFQWSTLVTNSRIVPMVQTRAVNTAIVGVHISIL